MGSLQRRIGGGRIGACVLVALPLVLGAAPEPEPTAKAATPKQVEMIVNQSQIITSQTMIKRASVANPDVAEVVRVLSPTEILLAAKKPGMTQVILWDEQGNPTTIDVLVTGDKRQLEANIKRLFPTSNVTLSAAQSTLVLKGTCADARQARAIAQLASAYSAEVINSLSVVGPKQVLLQVRVSEVNRSKLRRLGINWLYAQPDFFVTQTTNGIGSATVGTVPGNPLQHRMSFDLNPRALAGPISNVSVGIPSARSISFIDALKENGVMTVLAEPNLVALSGQKASFLVGGEFPIPVPQDENTVTIMFREFGIRLSFVPTILDDGTIRLEVEPEISDIDYSTAVQVSGFVVPGLITRKVKTAVELKNNQTFAIAGLISKSILATKSSVPVLGELPGIGPFFSSTIHRQEETELLVMVTAQLVDPLLPDQVPAAPTDYVRFPTDVEVFLFGMLEAPAVPAIATQPARIPALRGPLGQDIH